MSEVYEIKIVPKSNPNADGEWRTVQKLIAPPVDTLIATWAFFEEFVPDGFFMVAYRQTQFRSAIRQR